MKRKHPLDFPGSQAAELTGGYVVEIVYVPIMGGVDIHCHCWSCGGSHQVETTENLTPIGPVARALLKVGAK